MSVNNWIQLDDLRESWVFLLLGTDGSASESDPDRPKLSYWELGVGNAESLIQTTAERLDNQAIESEAELINNLGVELEQYRYQDILLITPERATLQLLRQRLSTTTPEFSSLRGFAHIALEEQLNTYFGQRLVDYEFERADRTPPRKKEAGLDQIASTGSVRAFWSLWTEILPLLPASELEGEPL